MRFPIVLRLIPCLILFSNMLFAQHDTLKYWIQFTDKNNSTFSVENPAAFLSQRAIERRTKESIPITEEDLPVNATYIDSLRQFSAVQILNPSKWFNGVTIACADTLILQQILTFPFVSSAQVVQKLKRKNESISFTEIPDSNEKNHLIVSVKPHIPYGYSYNQNHLHNIDALHDLGFNGEGKVIAVLDAGFLDLPSMPCFNQLLQENRILSTKDFVDHDGTVYNDDKHGSAVLCTMAGYVPNIYYGTAIKASFHLLRSENAATEFIIEEDNWLAAAEYADSVGADIITTSLGYTTFDDSTQNHTYADMDGKTTRVAQAANKASSKGILVIASAGNSGAEEWKYISTPGDADSVLTVGAVDSLGNYAYFSSIGPASDGEIKPNVASVGFHTYLYVPNEEQLQQANGTSFSAPMMAGMAATLWQALPNLKHYELKQLIESHSNQFENPDAFLGYGIPDFYAAYASKVNLESSKKSFHVQALYPNPIADNAGEMIVYSDIDQLIEFTIYSELGIKLYNTVLIIRKGYNQVNFSDFSDGAGMYFMQFKNYLNEVETQRFVYSGN